MEETSNTESQKGIDQIYQNISKMVAGPVYIIFGGIEGGEGIGIINGKIIRIPPHSPLIKELHKVANT